MSSRLGRTAVIYFVTQIGATLVGGIATWYINVRLGAAAFGEYSTAVAFLFWLNIPASAIGVAVKKRISEGEDKGAFLTAGHGINLAVHVAIVVLLITFREQVNVLIGLDVAVFFALLVAARAVFDMMLSSLRGFKQVGTSGALKTTESIFRSAIHIGAIAFLGVGVAGLILGHSVALLLAAFVGVLVLEGRPARPDATHAKRLGEYAQYSWLGTLKTRAFAWTDVIMMRLLSLSVIGLAAVSKDQIGIYRVAWTIASMLALVSLAVNQSLFPKFSELGVEENYDRVHHFLNEGLTFIGVFTIPGLFGAAAVGSELLTLFGAEYAVGGPILVVLVGARLVASYGEQLLSTINAIDRPDVAFRVNLGYVAANVTLNILFIWAFGWYGAAVATAVASLTSVVLAGYGLTRLIGRPDVPYIEFGYQVFASVVMFVVLVALQTVVPGTLPWTLFLVALGASVYSVVLLTVSIRIRAKAASLLPT